MAEQEIKSIDELKQVLKKCYLYVHELQKQLDNTDGVKSTQSTMSEQKRDYKVYYGDMKYKMRSEIDAMSQFDRNEFWSAQKKYKVARLSKMQQKNNEEDKYGSEYV